VVVVGRGSESGNVALRVLYEGRKLFNWSTSFTQYT